MANNKGVKKMENEKWTIEFSSPENIYEIFKTLEEAMKFAVNSAMDISHDKIWQVCPRYPLLLSADWNGYNIYIRVDDLDDVTYRVSVTYYEQK